ncbi:MAG TPA: histidine--tRNA ligase [bacterium]|nr:histidine--tRNA ligase [bacterium]HMW35461.1 histidine--tRNA ligase [bacterium]HMY35209.1 histidine--tRNA ligase [bacterium]HMZ03213.1 histidine--tRNA ligase [bacterium]HNB09429.1 histidine--tRNA ligase [bacterium]
MTYRMPTGTKDVLPSDSYKWQYVERKIADVMRRFNYKEIRTPMFEYTELFARGIGEATDVVGKEMYTFLDKGQESLTLRPELTASVMRSYIENSLGEQLPLNKCWYMGPMFRQERPQKGRLRQFHQFGVEALGSASPEADVETMLVVLTVYEELGIKALNFKINSVGCPQCRPAYRDALVAFLDGVKGQLSEESRKRLVVNPMRILDSKDERDIALTQSAPLMKDHLCTDCATHFSRVQSSLNGLGIVYEIDGRLVRGLDYYTKTAYEIQSGNLGSQNALGGGGRYDLLAEEFGGKPTPAVGFAAGIERLMIVLEAEGIPIGEPEKLDVYFIALGAAAVGATMPLIQKARREGLTCDTDLLARSMKAQMRDANRMQARFTVILGDNEIAQNMAVVKNMSDGAQEQISLNELTSYLKTKLA